MKIGILGASGVVGRQMIQCLEERKIQVDELRLFAHSSIGQSISFNGKDIVITAPDFEGLDYVLGAASNAVAKQYKDEIVKAGAVFIDNSSAFRQCDDVPLVVPEINGDDALNNHGVIANPNCSTIITLMAVKAINELSPIKAMIASTYQAVSGAGINGLRALESEVDQYVKNGEITDFNGQFEHQIAFNLLPKIGSFLDNEYSTEEMKMENEGRKIMHLPDLKVTCTCVRVPVLRSHSISVSVSTERDLSVEEVKEAMRRSKDVVYKEFPDYPMPLDSTDNDLTYVGRIRKDRVLENGISLFCSGDQIRKGAATNAVQIMEYIEEHGKH